VITGVVLAAGAGSRIGHPKALLRAGKRDETFTHRACGVMRDAGLQEIVIVVSAVTAEEVRAVAPSARVLVNDDPDRGQLSSLLIALGALSDEAEAILVLPVDIPLVRAETVRSLVASWVRTHAPVVRPVNAGRHGHPVIFSRDLFTELAAAPLSEGAKAVVRRHATPEGEVETSDPGAFLDVDTVEDYERAFGRLPERVRIR
jgi:molybdenum cofactor cytidylyltransferase/nicotine blue oxidoreductase